MLAVSPEGQTAHRNVRDAFVRNTPADAAAICAEWADAWIARGRTTLAEHIRAEATIQAAARNYAFSAY